ncbi:MAG TPA: cysteine desulfurase family protein [Polyangiaceae bacterium]|nr:cysteine desulfurase family protein [Polyangiaceae bacterium]
MTATESPIPIYLDWNATTPPLPDVVRAMERAALEAWGNPSSVHAAGRRARALVEDAREAVAELAAISPRDVVFTSGATEANNIALRGAPAIVTSRIEHPSVVRAAEVAVAEGRPVVWLPVPSHGRIEPAAVDAALDGLPRGTVVAVMAVNNETGVIQRLVDIEAIVRRRDARLHVDAVQAAGKIAPEQWRVGDTLSLGAHKIRGPKGIGALLLRTPGVPRPVVVGGPQERGIRPGTVDPIAAAGFAVAARRALTGPTRYASLAPLRDELEEALAAFAVVNGLGVERVPHVANLSFEGWRADELVAALDLAGVQVAGGSACSAGSAEPSKVVQAMLGAARAKSAVRFSLGDATSHADIDAAIPVILRVVARYSSTR